MSDEARIDRLADVLEAALAGPHARVPTGEPELADLLAIASDLRALPRPEFKARLGADLTRRIEMTVTVTRSGVREVIPYLAVRPALELVEFVKRAFGADELLRTTGSAGGVHAEVRIGDTRLMIGGGGAWDGEPTPTGLHLYVPDADRVYRAAVDAGAESLYAPVDQPYGDREAGVKDVAGNHWYIATHRSGGHVPEGLGTVTPFLHPRGASALIDFVTRAFGGEAVAVHHEPDGRLAHAIVRLGASAIEMGEAHDQWGPMPTMFYAYVDDVETWYRRALDAGAVSVEAPAPQPYGERRAAVRDRFDNTWYLAAPES